MFLLLVVPDVDVGDDVETLEGEVVRIAELPTNEGGLNSNTWKE